jgi:hypothetical protein
MGERTQTMKHNSTISMGRFTRQLTALMLSALLTPLAQLDLYAQAPPPVFAPLGAVQLDQLVAPIALYPDALVAQILTASTYPDQVTQANNWLHQSMGLPPDQRAGIANGMAWDPSVKALTAFPAVLDNLARNYTWASQLGNAYYNQPADVMNAVQAMRFQAQQSGTLLSTAQQRVYVDNGAIMIAPVNPALVYIPYYNPWRIWGPTFAAYPGYYVMPPPLGLAVGLGIGFAVGIQIGFFARYGWGYGAWAPNWRGGVVLYNHGAYYSRSVTVYNHGHFGGYNRGVFEHEGRGVPGGFHAAGTRADFGRPEGRDVGRPGARVAGRPEGREAARPEARAAARPAGRPEAARAAEPRAAARSAPAGRPAAPAARSAPAGRPAAPAAHAAEGGHKK